MRLVAAVVLGLTIHPPDPVTVIVGATLVDGGGRAPVADSVVVVRGAVIAAVGDRVHTPIPKGATLVDGRSAWIAPAPGAEAPVGTLATAIAALLRGPVARVQVGQPAHLALLDADPRRGAVPPRVRRLWIAGKGRSMLGASR